MGHTPATALGARENKEGLWEEVSSTLSPGESISVSTIGQCPGLVSPKNVKKQRYG